MTDYKKSFGYRCKKALKANIPGYIAIMPVILGILIFSLYPVLQTFLYGLHDYRILRGEWGKFTLMQYRNIFVTNRTTVLNSLKITLVYTAIMVSFNMVVGFFLAYWVNKRSPAMAAYKILLYLPCLIPTVISGLIWQNVADVDFGIGNAILTAVGIPKQTFLTEPSTSLPTFIGFSMFGVSSSIFIWLSALKSVPGEYYEAARVEGCGKSRQLVFITIPMITPFILYNLLVSVIGTMQMFGGVYTLTGGTAGMEDSLNFFVVYIYRQAFTSFNISYASALSWVLFVFIAALAAVLLKTSRWVFYNEEA